MHLSCRCYADSIVFILHHDRMFRLMHCAVLAMSLSHLNFEALFSSPYSPLLATLFFASPCVSVPRCSIPCLPFPHVASPCLLIDLLLVPYPLLPVLLSAAIQYILLTSLYFNLFVALTEIVSLKLLHLFSLPLPTTPSPLVFLMNFLSTMVAALHAHTHPITAASTLGGLISALLQTRASSAYSQEYASCSASSSLPRGSSR